MALSEDRIARYSRQLLVPGFDEGAQERLLGARVRVVGADAVAAPALVALVQAGVGRIWIDDPEDVSPADLAGWLYPPAAVATPRTRAAAAALAPLSSYVLVDAYPTGGVPSAALVAAPSIAQALAAAEEARRAGIPHVVIEPDGEGGAVITVPPGAPCYSCGRSTGGAGRPPTPGIAALASLAAQELIQLVAFPGGAGRRVDLVRGVATVRPTVRLAGCACSPSSVPAEG
ncbi:MAG TPA: ThiF family adenylyltransferase [Anaeromyxobacter sp.]|nr:ThiF family adenylyltransferase [Anaeromyxobacter sp.]